MRFARYLSAFITLVFVFTFSAQERPSMETNEDFHRAMEELFESECGYRLVKGGGS